MSTVIVVVVVVVVVLRRGETLEKGEIRERVRWIDRRRGQREERGRVPTTGWSLGGWRWRYGVPQSCNGRKLSTSKGREDGDG